MTREDPRTGTPPPNLGSTIVALVTGAGMGGAAVAGALGTAAAFGTAPDAEMTVVALLAIGFILGDRLDPGGASGTSARRGLGTRLAGLGVLGLGLGLWSSPLGGTLARVGGTVDAGPIGITLARALLGGLVLVPTGFLLGAAMKLAARAEAVALPAAIVGVGAGALIANLIVLFGSDTPVEVGGASVLLAAGLGLRFAPGRVTADEAAAPRPAAEPDGAAADPLPGGLAGGFAAAAFAFLTARALVPAFGSELPEIPVAAILLAAGFTLGATIGAVASRYARAGTVTAAVAFVAASVVAIAWLGRFDRFPIAFVPAIDPAPDLDTLIRLGFRVAAGTVAPIGALLGAGFAVLLGTAPAARRSAWMARLGIGAAIGVTLGTGFSRWALGPLTLQDTIVGGGVVTTVFASVAGWRSAAPLLLRAGLPIAAAAIVGVVVSRLPAPDGNALGFQSEVISPITRTSQKTWLVFERDGVDGSVAVFRRGTWRRSLVDGRFETANGIITENDGVLAHLPLSIHARPERVLLLGSGNGAALGSALSHPIERLDCFAIGRASVGATAEFGPAVRDALADDRIRVRIGDPVDLLARAPGYDVILNLLSGSWTTRSARVSTQEFLELVRDRLDEDGIYCQWVPDSALTKTGLQILLATFASVFPQVEVWAGHRGSVVVLAKKRNEPHDFESVLASYRRPEVAANARDVWLEEPLSLLSHFLASDSVVRRISTRHPVHTRGEPRLGRAEAARRRSEPTVNPVPGLFALGDDVIRCFTNTPATGFDLAVANALRARALERQGFVHELERPVAPGQAKAIDAYQEALGLNPRDRVVRRSLADLRSRMGIDFTNRQASMAAHSNLRQAVEIDTTFAEGFANLGRYLVMGEEFDYAIAVVEQAIALEPDNDLFHLLRARIWKRRRYYDKAIASYEKAMELNPLNAEAAMGYIDTQLAMEEEPDLEGGLEFCRRYLAIEPDNEDVKLRVAKLERAIRLGLRRPPEEAAGAAASP